MDCVPTTKKPIGIYNILNLILGTLLSIPHENIGHISMTFIWDGANGYSLARPEPDQRIILIRQERTLTGTGSETFGRNRTENK